MAISILQDSMPCCLDCLIICLLFWFAQKIRCCLLLVVVVVQFLICLLFDVLKTIVLLSLSFLLSLPCSMLSLLVFDSLTFQASWFHVSISWWLLFSATLPTHLQVVSLSVFYCLLLLDGSGALAILYAIVACWCFLHEMSWFAAYVILWMVTAVQGNKCKASFWSKSCEAAARFETWIMLILTTSTEMSWRHRRSTQPHQHDCHQPTFLHPDAERNIGVVDTNMPIINLLFNINFYRDRCEQEVRGQEGSHQGALDDNGLCASEEGDWAICTETSSTRVLFVIPGFTPQRPNAHYFERPNFPLPAACYQRLQGKHIVLKGKCHTVGFQKTRGSSDLILKTAKTGMRVQKPERQHQKPKQGYKNGTTVPETGTRAPSPKPPFYKTALVFPLDVPSMIASFAAFHMKRWETEISRKWVQHLQADRLPQRLHNKASSCKQAALARQMLVFGIALKNVLGGLWSLMLLVSSLLRASLRSVLDPTGFLVKCIRQVHFPDPIFVLLLNLNLGEVTTSHKATHTTMRICIWTALPPENPRSIKYVRIRSKRESSK